MKKIGQVFLKGLVVILPVVVTAAVLYWLFHSAELILGKGLQWALPEGTYKTGMGVLIAFCLIFLIGILVDAYLIRRVFSLIDSLLEKIPIVKTLYSSARDLTKFIVGDKDSNLEQVVAVSINGVRLIGFVTKEEVTLGKTEGLTAIYLPMSYQMGGYLVYLPPEDYEPLDMGVQEAMQMIITADITKRKKTSKSHSK